MKNLIPAHVSIDRSMLGLTGSIFIVPEELKDNAIKLLETAAELNGHAFPYEVKTLKVNFHTTDAPN